MSKLITVLIKKLNNVKEESKDVTLDFSNNKESIYDDLLIPLINLTKSDDLTKLHENLNVIVNGSYDSEEFKTLSELLITYLMDDKEDDSETDLYEEFSNLMLNCMAIYNSLSDQISNNTITSMNEELTTYINSKFKIPEDEDSEIETEEIEEIEETETDSNEDVIKEETKVKLKIISAKDNVDDASQAEVNKIELKNNLMNYLENSTKKEKDSIKAIIDETFAIVSSYEKTNDWQYPHHTLKDNELTLNVNGLKAAALFLLKPTTSKNLSSEDRIKIANHLCKHYDELDIETPDKLTNISENSESTVVVNVNDDELKEYAESFDIGVENVSIYIGLFESLVTDLVNSGVIDIKDKSKDADDSIIPVQLSKDQVEEFLKYFDIMSDDILNILSNKLTSMSYKKTDADLENKLSASESIISDLKEKIDGLDDTIKTQASELKKSTSVKYDKSLVDNKFAVIINFVKSADNQNDTLIQFINNVIEAESERDIGYLTKLGKSFMKSKGTDSTQFIKKSKVVNRFNDDDYDKLLGYVGKDKGEDVKESVESSRIERLMDYL